MSYSFETLQDFVLNLVNDQAAKAAYDADPLGALADAGLGDLTEADVAEVLPLVTDSLPLEGELPLVGDLPSLPLDSLPFDSLPDGLPGLPTDHLPIDVPSLPVIETPLGDLSASLTGTAGHLGLDGDLLDTESSLLTQNVDGGATASSYVESLVGDLAAGAKLSPEEFGGSVAGSTELADAGLGLVGHPDSVAAWAGVDTVAGDLGGGLLVDAEGVALAAESPLGDLSLDSDGSYSIQPADPADLLDADVLGDVGDAVVGTVASYVSTGSDALADSVANGADTLGGFLTGPLAPVGDVVDSGSNTVVDGIQQGGDALSEGLSAIPTVDGLPLDQLPELGDLPELPELPVVDHLPVDLDDLPLDLPSLPVDLPIDLPALPANPVVDVVGSSPVGGVANSALSPVTDLTDNLGLDLL